MTIVLKSFSALAACLALVPAWAAESGYVISASAPYLETTRVPDAVRSECALERYVGEQALEAIAKRFPGSTAAAELSGQEAQALRLSILSVDAVGGGAWTGRKGMTIKAELLQAGTSVDSRTFFRENTGGVFGAFKGTCTMLERNADSISKDMVKWLLIRQRTALKEAAAQAEDASAEGAEAPASKSALPSKEPFKLLPVSFSPTLVVPDNVRAECNVENFFTDELASQLRARYSAMQLVQAAEESLTGKALKVTLVSVDAPAGGNWSGAKSLDLRAEWLENGVVVSTTNLNRKAGWTISGPRGTCALLDRTTRALSKDVLRWMLNGRTPQVQATETSAASVPPPQP